MVGESNRSVHIFAVHVPVHGRRVVRPGRGFVLDDRVPRMGRHNPGWWHMYHVFSNREQYLCSSV